MPVVHGVISHRDHQGQYKGCFKTFVKTFPPQDMRPCTAVFERFRAAIHAQGLAKNVYFKEQFISEYELEGQCPFFIKLSHACHCS